MNCRIARLAGPDAEGMFPGVAGAVLCALMCVFAAACAQNSVDGQEQDGNGRNVSVRFYCVAETRSGCAVDETAVGDVNVYAYADGRLAAETYCADYGGTGGSGLSLELQSGKAYEIYALANVGQVHAPTELSALRAMRLPAHTGVRAGGALAEYPQPLPMAYMPDGPLEVSAERTGVALKLTRLVSRVNFSFDRSGLAHSAVEITSVRVRQAASDVTPFEACGKALATDDGDLAGESDLAVLNASGGGTASFYVPENCRGVLLPGNTDHWAKVPENLPVQERNLCTYLEVKGTYTSPGVVGDNLVYRLYLGGDNCSDFSLRRNLDYTVTLSATDDGVFLSSWKVELGEYEDCRELRFDRDTLVLWQGGGAGTAEILCAPASLEHSLSVDGDAFRAAALDWTRRGNEVELSSSFVGPEVKWARMFLSSWDGRHRDTLTVKLDYVPGEFMEYINLAPRYCGQWGTLEFPTASADSPVVTECGGREMQIGGSVARSLSARMPGSSGYLNLVYSPTTPQTLYLMAEEAGEIPEITISRSTLSTTLRLPDTIYPSYALRLTRDLCESGDINTDERDGFPYDAEASVLLADSDGNILDLETFARPEALIEADIDDDPDNYFDEKYDDMCYRFIGRTSVSFPFGDDLAGFRLKRSGIEEATAGRLAQWQMWGLKADGDRAATAVVRISNGYYSSGNMFTDIPVTVQPVFGQWRWLGEVTDWQLAPDSRRSSECSLAGDRPRPNCGGSVSWQTKRGSFRTDERPDEALWNASDYNYGVTFSPAAIRFSDDDEDFLSHGGAFIARGSTVNPHSGRTIFGYYTFDSVLYLPVGAQVSLEGVGDNSTTVHYAFSPFTEMACADWCGSWPGLENLVGIHCTGWTPTGPQAVSSYVTVPEEGDNGSYPLEFRSDVQRLDNSSSFAAINLLLSSFTQTYFTFKFEVDGNSFDSLDFTRNGYASYFSGSALSSRESGSYGFYLLRRQQDEATVPGGYAYGLENCLLEAWLHSYSLH